MIERPMDFGRDVEVRCRALLVQMLPGEIVVMQKVGPELSNALLRKKIETRVNIFMMYKNINIPTRADGWNLVDLLTQPKTFQHNGFEAATLCRFKIGRQGAAQLGGRTFVSFDLFPDELVGILWNGYIVTRKDLHSKHCHPIMSQKLYKAQPVDVLQTGMIIFVAPGMSKLISESFFGR